MYDRVIRADLYQSDRWLDLPTDTHRLVFNALVHEADDFGNLDGGARRLFRFMQRFCQVKTEADAMKIMNDLADADLVRRYEVFGTEYWHLPRFKNTRRYTSRKYPRSPWCDSEKLATAEKLHKQNNNGKAKPAADLPQTYSRPAGDLLRGEERRGVGEVLERGRSGEERSSVVGLVSQSLWGQYGQHRAALGFALTAPTEKLALQDLQRLCDAGNDPVKVIEQAIRKGRSRLEPVEQDPYDEWLERQDDK